MKTVRSSAVVFLLLATMPSTGAVWAMDPLASCEQERQPVQGYGAPLLSIRATAALPEKAERWIAHVSMPEPVWVEAHAMIDTEIRRHCGHISTAYRDELAAINPGLAIDTPLKEPRSVNLPACPYWEVDSETEKIIVRQALDETLEDIIQREIGRKSTEILSTCIPGNASLECRDILSIVTAMNQNGESNGEIRLPQRTRAVTFAVRPACYTRGRDAAHELGDIVRKDLDAAKVHPLILNVVVDSDLEIARPLQETKIQDADCREAQTAWGGVWPFDAEAVAQRLKSFMATEAIAKKLLGRPVVAGVIDSGLVFYDRNGANLDEPIPHRFLNLKPSECTAEDGKAQDGTQCRGRPGEDNDHDGWGNDIYGASANRDGHIRPVRRPDDELFLHGTEVTDLMLGGSAMRNTFSELNKLVNVRIYRADRRIQQNSGDPPQIAPMSPSDLTALVSKAVQESDLINLSAGTSAALGDIVQFMGGQSGGNRSRALLIAAAGNADPAGMLLGRNPLYPANYGGDGTLRDSMITVAAHDGAGHLAPFSNYGPTRVDLAAPGCDIGFIGPSGQDQKLFGTSFAAPLVSFTAALLRALGLDTAREIKTRLLAAATYEPALEGSVFAGGRLDILKAINVFDDVLVTKEQPQDLILGDWQVDQDDTMLCKDSLPLPVESVLKVRPAWDRGKLVLHLLLRDWDWRLDQVECEPNSPPILSFRRSDSGIVNQYKWEQIADLVPKPISR